MSFGNWTLNHAEQQWIAASAHHLAGQIRTLLDALKKRPDDHEVRLTLQETIAEARQLGLIRLDPAR